MTDATVEITTEDELREVLGIPNERARDKVRTVLDPLDVEWLAHSPFVLVGTSDADGRGDVSPKGDPDGIATVLDERTVVIPERPGNKRGDGFVNVLSNPHVGLLFLIPGRSDTLRVNGRARIVRDAPWFDRMTVAGHRPVLALVVDVDEVFYHCQKAFLRSKLWQPDTWRPDAMPSRAQISKAVERPDDPIEELEAYYGPSYADGLYRA
ncbi:pyridoxamine 5'-phosphate oxidase family protein [Jatrophihabitans sp. YIM 134969]